MSAAFTPDMLVSQTPPAPPSGPAPTSQYETADTARAYYDAIDPSGAKKTLSGWLTANCFDASAADYGADAHAVYTNNYDLGFGRDMYFAACTAGGPGKPGDMAWIVFNYATVEATASKLNPIIAVAMEYSAATDGSNPTRRFPKFYVFAPNDRDGSFERVLTSNFDHRGEKYVPGTCIACHGGVLPVPRQFLARRADRSKILDHSRSDAANTLLRPGAAIGIGRRGFGIHALGSRFASVCGYRPRVRGLVGQQGAVYARGTGTDPQTIESIGQLHLSAGNRDDWIKSAHRSIPIVAALARAMVRRDDRRGRIGRPGLGLRANRRPDGELVAE